MTTTATPAPPKPTESARRLSPAELNRVRINDTSTRLTPELLAAAAKTKAKTKSQK